MHTLQTAHHHVPIARQHAQQPCWMPLSLPSTSAQHHCTRQRITRPLRAIAKDEDIWVDGDGNPIPPEERDLYPDADTPEPPRERAFPDEQVIEAIGMGMWRLRDTVDIEIEQLVAQIEGAVRCVVDDDDMRVTPPGELFSIMDSLDPLQELYEGLSYMSVDDPTKGAPNYPRLLIENRCYSTRVFRKIHFEVAWQQDGLQVLHIVMYPRLQYDLPILGLDLVGSGNNRFSLAVLDACPVSVDRSLPPTYASAMQQLQETYGLSSNRDMPEWGARIFSPLCVLVRPTAPDDMTKFIRYAIAVARVHLELSLLATPVPSNEGRRLKHIAEAHARFCEAQLSNKKTTSVLIKAFGEELAQRYLTHVMFDHAHALETQGEGGAAEKTAA